MELVPKAEFSIVTRASTGMDSGAYCRCRCRTELTKKLWEYVRKHELQDSKDKRNIRADEELLAVFDGKKVVSMFEMTKLVNGHLV